MALKIFHVVGTMTGWDSFSDFVCIAPDAEAARRIHPSDWRTSRWSDERERWVDEDGSDTYQDGSWDPHIKTIEATEIGMANEDSKVGVVCSSFHAG